MCWGRDRIFAAAAGLTDEQFVEPCSLDYGSISATLAHQLSSERLLFSRWRGAATPAGLETAPSLAALEAAWREHEAELRVYVDGLTDANLDRSFQYTTRSGAAMAEPLWQSMFQVANHGTQHRSEVALALTQLGHSPGFLDFVAYVRERQAQTV
jgi:uncharacterized damage-inducible protein DinB